MKVAITGGTGFVGQTLCQKLQDAGHEPIVLSQRAASNNRWATRQVDYRQPHSIHEALDGSHALINLIGILHQTKQQSFDWVHNQLVCTLLDAAAQCGIRDYIHMSALGVDHRGPSEYLRSKAEGEDAAFERCKQHGIRMVSLRPSIIFGEQDQFFNQFAQLLRWSPVMPLVCPNASFQPVAVEDVAAAFIWALESSVDRVSYELGGTQVMTMHEVVTFVCQSYGWKRWIIPLPDRISAAQAKLMGHLPKSPLTYDNYLSMRVPNTTEQSPWEQMGITPKRVYLHTQSV